MGNIYANEALFLAAFTLRAGLRVALKRYESWPRRSKPFCMTQLAGWHDFADFVVVMGRRDVLRSNFGYTAVRASLQGCNSVLREIRQSGRSTVFVRAANADQSGRSTPQSQPDATLPHCQRIAAECLCDATRYETARLPPAPRFHGPATKCRTGQRWALEKRFRIPDPLRDSYLPTGTRTQVSHRPQPAKYAVRVLCGNKVVNRPLKGTTSAAGTCSRHACASDTLVSRSNSGAFIAGGNGYDHSLKQFLPAPPGRCGHW